jgi:hypothetical protein
LSAAAAFAELFVRTIQPTIDSGEVTLLVDALLDVVARVPVSTLHFRPEPAAYVLARDSVAAATSAA